VKRGEKGEEDVWLDSSHIVLSLIRSINPPWPKNSDIFTVASNSTTYCKPLVKYRDFSKISIMQCLRTVGLSKSSWLESVLQKLSSLSITEQRSGYSDFVFTYLQYPLEDFASLSTLVCWEWFLGLQFRRAKPLVGNFLLYVLKTNATWHCLLYNYRCE
jgi:hypothetical protein